MKLYLNCGYIISSYVPLGIKGTYYMKIFSPVVDNLAPATSTTVTGTFDATVIITHINVGFNANAQGFPKYSQNDFSCRFKARGDVADVPAGILAIANGIAEEFDKSNTSKVGTEFVSARNIYVKCYSCWCWSSIKHQ